MKKEKLMEVVNKELEKYLNRDVLVYYERVPYTLGFFTWSGHVHVQTTITELRQEGFEKSDIKELRDEADRFLVVEEAGNFRIEKMEKKS